MKKIFLLIILIFISYQNNAQERNVPQKESSTQKTNSYDNLLYTASTFTKLSKIVDSLNLKFKVCEPQNFSSLKQSNAIFFKVKSTSHNQIIQELKNEVALDKIINKYKNTITTQPESLVVEFSYTTYDNENVKLYKDIALNEKRYNTIRFVGKENQYQNSKYIFEYKPKSEYAIRGFYLIDGLNSKQLGKSTTKLIQYVDCLVDTTSTKFKNTAKTGRPIYPENIDDLSFEKKKTLLDTLRNTLVFGSCSMDNSPKIHAQKIAKLAGETHNWKIFLKSHLDILNDNFTRMSDASYAQARRKTYIKELEVLNIDVVKLLLGSSFSVIDANKNHYFGNIHRIARAISESENKEEFEKQILEIIRDKEIDTYNRYKFIWLFETYLNYLEPKEKKRKEKEIQLLNEKYS